MDSNIALSALFGRRGWDALRHVAQSRNLFASARTAEEIDGVLSRTERLRAAGLTASDFFAVVMLVEADRYENALDTAAACLRHAVASRDGNGRDAHVLALAWTLDADIWSHDRDFAGTGWPSWSTANLRSALSPGPSGIS